MKENWLPNSYYLYFKEYYKMIANNKSVVLIGKQYKKLIFVEV